jgi:hypothetical protein
MFFFDAGKEWVILAPSVQKTAAEELSRCIDLLRAAAGLALKAPLILDSAGPAPGDSVPVIVLNAESGDRDRNGYSWRLGSDRLEIYGNSDRGLVKGVFDFLAALGIRWPEPGKEELPPSQSTAVYPIRAAKVCVPSALSPAARQRVIFSVKKTRERDAFLAWAARNGADALVIPLREMLKVKAAEGLKKSAELYALIIEWGGWDLSLLVPRRLFFFHRDYFRMESGKRVKQYHFCPTNPDTINVLKKQAALYFGSAVAGSSVTPLRQGETTVPVYHLRPDKGREKTWCSCPACRAFSPAEQNRIAVNAAADVLAEINPAARLSYFEETLPAEQDSENGIPPRPNLFPLITL